MAEHDIEDYIEDAMNEVSAIGDDTDNFSQAESAEFYEGVAHQCTTRANAIREEMG